MPAPEDGTEPISPDEILYRRIPVKQNWFDRTTDPRPSRYAFRPTDKDATGISVFRAKYQTARETAGQKQGKSYFIAKLRAGDLQAHGLEIVPRPQPGVPGHAEIASIKFEEPRTSQTEQAMLLLAEKLCLGVEGPFP